MPERTREPSETDQQAAVEGISEYDTGVHVTPIPRSATPFEHLRHDLRVEAFRREKGDRDLHKRFDRFAEDAESKLSALSLEVSRINVHMFGYQDAQGRGRFGQLEQQLVAQAARLEEHARTFKQHAETFEKLERLQFKIVVSASLAGSAVAVLISVIEWVITH